MVLPEQLEHLLVAGLLWVVVDFDGFRVVTTEGKVPPKTAGQASNTKIAHKTHTSPDPSRTKLLAGYIYRFSNCSKHYFVYFPLQLLDYTVECKIGGGPRTHVACNKQQELPVNNKENGKRVATYRLW